MNIEKENITNEDKKYHKKNKIKEGSNLDQDNIILEEIDIKNKRINELEDLINQIKIRDRDNILRLQAEIENMRRRNEQDIEKAHKFGLENFIYELLPVIDNLERAIFVASEKENNEISSIIEGIQLTLKSLLKVVNKFGLHVIEENNVIFNPEIHQAMTLIESDKYEPNKVINIMQKGYILNGRLVRPAMVTVSKEKK